MLAVMEVAQKSFTPYSMVGNYLVAGNQRGVNAGSSMTTLPISSIFQRDRASHQSANRLSYL